MTHHSVKYRWSVIFADPVVPSTVACFVLLLFGVVMAFTDPYQNVDYYRYFLRSGLSFLAQGLLCMVVATLGIWTSGYFRHWVFPVVLACVGLIWGYIAFCVLFSISLLIALGFFIFVVMAAASVVRALMIRRSDAP